MTIRYLDMTKKCEISSAVIKKEYLDKDIDVPSNIISLDSSDPVFTFTEGKILDFDNLDADGKPTKKDVLTPEQILDDEKKDAEREEKLAGVEYNNIMCSATWKDQFGLTGHRMLLKEGINLPPFEFENGSRLLLTSENIDEFMAVWLPFRTKFFEV